MPNVGGKHMGFGPLIESLLFTNQTFFLGGGKESKNLFWKHFPTSQRLVVPTNLEKTCSLKNHLEYKLNSKIFEAASPPLTKTQNLEPHLGGNMLLALRPPLPIYLTLEWEKDTASNKKLATWKSGSMELFLSRHWRLTWSTPSHTIPCWSKNEPCCQINGIN